MSFDKSRIIAGPCSAESREQVLKTVEELSSLGYTTIRAGVWKPRTMPGGFEGYGVKALTWLKEAKEKFGVKIATEIATPTQLCLANNYGIDIFWIGARTTSDPFAIQELVSFINEIKETDKAIYEEIISKEVLIKNPVCPDVSLWEGSYLRLKNAGLNITGLVHRGFKDYMILKFRNNPIWEIPIKMKVMHPELDLIFDPSHISGNAKYIKELIRQAEILHYDKYLIEVHINPKDAITDAKQQLTPKQLDDILISIDKSKKEEKEMSEKDKELLKEYRMAINDADDKILEWFETRMGLSEKIGELKKKYNLPVFQKDRFIELLNRLKEKGSEYGIDPKVIDSIWFPIHQASLEQQI